MAAPSEFHFYTDTFTKINSTLTTYVTDVATNVISSITPAVMSFVLLYFILWGWSMMRGIIQEPIMDGLSRLLKLCFITSLALSIGNYNGYIADFLFNAPDAMAAVVATGKSDAAQNIQYLDTMMGQVYDFGDGYWQKGNASTIPNLGLIIIALLIWAAGLISTAYAAFLLILSKLTISVFFGDRPTVYLFFNI